MRLLRKMCLLWLSMICLVLFIQLYECACCARCACVRLRLLRKMRSRALALVAQDVLVVVVDDLFGVIHTTV